MIETAIKEKTACFTGHRKIPSEDLPMVKTNLRNAVIDSIEKGYERFLAGGALGFDTLAANMVLELKKRYPHIKLILVLPCREQTKGWKQSDIKKYERIKSQADEIVYTSEHYYRGCMHVRNRHLVDHSSLCICYLTKETGGTAYTVRYARTKRIGVV